MNKAVQRLLDNDLLKVVLISYSALCVQEWMIFISLIYLNRFSSYFLSQNGPQTISLILYILFGLLAGFIIKRKTILRAFYSGLLLSAMLMISYLEKWSLSLLLAYIKEYPHILAPGIIFFIMASFADDAFHKKDRPEIWEKRARILTVGLLFLFLGLLGNRVYQYYAYISSAAYKNALRADLPLPAGAQEVVHREDRKTGVQFVSFMFQTSDKSWEIYRYYDEHCLKSGFFRTGSSGPVWQEEDQIRADLPKSSSANWFLAESWDNYQLEIEAFLVIRQISDIAQNPSVQRVSFYMMPNPKKYRKWFRGVAKE